MQRVVAVAAAVISLSTCCGARSFAGSACSRVSYVEVRHKDYFEAYLSFNHTSKAVNTMSFFYTYITTAVRTCCNHVSVNFTFLNTSNEVEDLALLALMNGYSGIPKPFVFYFPEFAIGKEKVVHDYELSFVKLSKSPGHAVIMKPPKPKEPVSLFYVFGELLPMLAMMLVMSWLVGILGWIADHWKNPEEFPEPFVRGMFEGFWWAVVTMTTVGYGDKAPRSPCARFLAVVWVMMSAVFLSLFTANATSILDQSLLEEDHTGMIGKTIGVFQSKSFDEVTLNMGAKIINYNNINDLWLDFENGKLDFFLYPDYKDFLWAMKAHKGFEGQVKVVKVFDIPFQIGMVLSMHPKSINPDDNSFLTCLRSAVSYRERRLKRELNYWSIAQPKDDRKKTSSGLDQGRLMSITEYTLASIAVIACFGLAWDVWKCYSRRKTMNSEVSHDVEPGKENGAMGLKNVQDERTPNCIQDDAK